MPSKLDRWRALRGDERRLLVALVVLLPMIGATLRLSGFRRTQRLLGQAGRSSPDNGQADDDGYALAIRLGRLVNIASRRGPYTATCLGRSLALWWLLQRRGLPAEVRIGVGKDEGRLRAHAWVELGGRVVNDRPAVAGEYAVYSDLDRFRATWAGKRTLGARRS